MESFFREILDTLIRYLMGDGIKGPIGNGEGRKQATQGIR